MDCFNVDRFAGWSTIGFSRLAVRRLPGSRRYVLKESLEPVSGLLSGLTSHLKQNPNPKKSFVSFLAKIASEVEFPQSFLGTRRASIADSALTFGRSNGANVNCVRAAGPERISWFEGPHVP